MVNRDDRSGIEVPVALDLPVSVYQVPGPEGNGTMWLARSVATGHVVHSRTEERAVEALLMAIHALIDVARRVGQTPLGWYGEQEPDRSCYAQEYDRIRRNGGISVLPLSVGAGGYCLVPTKAVCQAA